MFDSGISAADLIAEIQSETDIVLPISNKTYVTWLNSLEQLLYGDIIREQREASFENTINTVDTIDLSNITPGTGEAALLFDDVCDVYVDGVQYTKASIDGKRIFKNTYYKKADGNVGLTTKNILFMNGGKKEIVNVSGNVAAAIIPDNNTVRFTVPSRYDSNDDLVIPASLLRDIAFGNMNGLTVSVTSELDSDCIGAADIYLVMHDTQHALGFVQPVTIAANKLENPFYIRISYQRHSPNARSIEEFKIEAYMPSTVNVLYNVCPALKTVNVSDVVQAGNVAVPIEFIDMVKAKLRAEAYKLSNEDGLASKWMSDYDVLLENFKAWVQSRRPQLGM